ncbi:hypothetical protein [Bogoriella caseilytica]|uniref:LPXTG-motif cell wall-anchored protein n=1 Tax=Bogoriella caseilytica TaxID=56055 RepID=A0A3N2BDL4_9MICO|nr:hypothetical protein [Bogoriella caseilytica]ROR73338.1 hypothetical protein EDD31_1715 [Bogoriella caseilytica]
MKRRALAAAAAAAALALAPSAAMADYAGAGTILIPTDIVAGEPVLIIVDTPDELDGTTVTLTVEDEFDEDGLVSIEGANVAGVSTGTTTAANSMAQFWVTFPADGTYLLTATDENGNVLATSVVTIGEAAVPPPGETPPGETPPPGTTPPGIPAQGSEVLPIVLGAGVLLVAGAGVMVYARNRQSTTA